MLENKAVIISKYETLNKCINRINEEYENNPDSLEDCRKQDGIALNLQRACEAIIDIAMYEVSNKKLGVPQTKKEAIELLYKNNVIDEKMHSNIKRIIDIKNKSVHDYKRIDEDILIDVIENHLNDLIDFAKVFLTK